MQNKNIDKEEILANVFFFLGLAVIVLLLITTQLI